MASKALAYVLSTCLCIGAIFLIQEREGLLAWVTLGLGIASLFASYRLQGQTLAVVLTATIGLASASWALTLYLVYSTWESGEVVEVSVSPDLILRTWVVEIDNYMAIIYDSPPEHQTTLESAQMVEIARGELRMHASVKALPVSLQSDELIDVYAHYEHKYANQSWGTDIYYLLIGPRRGSQLYVLHLSPTAALLEKSP